MILSILSILSSLLELIRKVPAWIDEWVKSRVDKASQERSDGIKKGIEDAKKAQTIEQKADAACEIQHSIDPNSSC